MAQGVAIGLVALLFILLAWSLVHDEGGDLSKKANAGETPSAPDFTLERLDQEGEIGLSSFRGKAVVLNVWASWCMPCKDEAPCLEEVWQRWRDDGVVFVGMGLSKDFRADARRFVAPLRRHVPDGVRRPRQLDREVRRDGLPETFVIDREGRVVTRVRRGGERGGGARPTAQSAIEDALS